MSRISAIHHVNIPIRDIERTKEWYQRIFDAELKEHPRQLELYLGSSELHCHLAKDPVYLETNHYAVEITDWDEMMSHLKKEGISFDGDRAPGIRDYDGHHYAYIRDPDGNLIELMNHPA